DVWVLAEQPPHVAAEDRDHLGPLDRLHRRRAALVIEHRQLAEDVAQTELRERDRAAVLVLADRAHMPRAHAVAGVALIALAEHDLAGIELPRHRDLSHTRELLLGERREHRHPFEQGDRVLARRGHSGISYHSRGELSHLGIDRWYPDATIRQPTSVTATSGIASTSALVATSNPACGAPAAAHPVSNRRSDA